MEKFKNLIEIKKIIALTLTFVFCYLAVRRFISSTEFLSVFTLVVGFYFGQSTARAATKEGK